MRIRMSCLKWAAPAVAVLVFVCGGPAQAQTYTWDAVAGNGQIDDGPGTWSVGGPNWFDGTNYDQNWYDGANAVFGGGVSGTAGVVAISGGVSPASVTFNQPFAGNYTISGDPINLNSNGIADNATGTTTINSNIALGATQNLFGRFQRHAGPWRRHHRWQQPGRHRPRHADRFQRRQCDQQFGDRE